MRVLHQGSLHTPEQCLVTGGLPLFWWKKRHVSNGCNMYLFQEPCAFAKKNSLPRVGNAWRVPRHGAQRRRSKRPKSPPRCPNKNRMPRLAMGFNPSARTPNGRSPNANALTLGQGQALSTLSLHCWLVLSGKSAPLLANQQERDVSGQADLLGLTLCQKMPQAGKTQDDATCLQPWSIIHTLAIGSVNRFCFVRVWICFIFLTRQNVLAGDRRLIPPYRVSENFGKFRNFLILSKLSACLSQKPDSYPGRSLGRRKPSGVCSVEGLWPLIIACPNVAAQPKWFPSRCPT